MVRSWQRLPADEDAVCAAWSGNSRGYPLREAAAAIGGTSRQLNPEAPQNYEYLRVTLEEPRWIIAQLFGAELLRVAQATNPRPVSPFGALTHLPYGALHAVVLVGADAAGLSYLDPFYLPDGQPFRLTREQFVYAWQGAVVISAGRSG